MEEKISELINKGVPTEKTDLIDYIFKLETSKEKNEKELDSLKEDIKELEDEISIAKESLLSKMKQDKDEMFETNNNLVAQFIAKNEFSYGDEKALLNKLQELKLSNYIKTTTKVTTSIDKNTLKKDLKTNESLKESLKDFIGDRVTEFVVVTTKENHTRMLEHIEENKK